MIFPGTEINSNHASLCTQHTHVLWSCGGKVACCCARLMCPVQAGVTMHLHGAYQSVIVA